MTSYDSQGDMDGFDSTQSRKTGSTNGKWGEAKPLVVSFADSLSPKANVEVWNKLYKYAGMPTANEKERMAIRAAVYVYCCKNGTSREGDYSMDIKIANGADIPSNIIPRAAGKMNIRKFMRANMGESIECFRESRVMEEDERFVKKASEYGIPPESAFCMADWLDDCPALTPSESKYHNMVFAKSIERARRAREGKSLEGVEESRVDAAIVANGPRDAIGSVRYADY